MQLIGIDVDKNAIQRIECGKRFVTDIELVAFADVFSVDVGELVSIGYPLLLTFFLTTTDLIKDTKAIMFLSNSQASLTNRVKCGIMLTLHKLHIFSLIRENTLVKSVFSLFSYRIGESLCSNIRGGAFFRCIPSGVHLFICG